MKIKWENKKGKKKVQKVERKENVGQAKKKAKMAGNGKGEQNG